MEIIFAYTRAQAIADGVLIDVSEMAREAGFGVHAALTHAAWSRCVEVPEGLACQDEAGRLWDVLWMLGSALVRDPSAHIDHFDPRKRGSRTVNQVLYSVCVQNEPERLERVELKAVCGPGDKGESVITIMLPHED